MHAWNIFMLPHTRLIILRGLEFYIENHFPSEFWKPFPLSSKCHCNAILIPSLLHAFFFFLDFLEFPCDPCCGISWCCALVRISFHSSCWILDRHFQSTNACLSVLAKFFVILCLFLSSFLLIFLNPSFWCYSIWADPLALLSSLLLSTCFIPVFGKFLKFYTLFTITGFFSFCSSY